MRSLGPETVIMLVRSIPWDRILTPTATEFGCAGDSPPTGAGAKRQKFFASFFQKRRPFCFFQKRSQNVVDGFATTLG
jgi:hypothetical protein